MHFNMHQCALSASNRIHYLSCDAFLMFSNLRKVIKENNIAMKTLYIKEFVFKF